MPFFRGGNFHKLDKAERGAVAVEFALIVGILLTIVFAVIEFGLFFSRYQVFQGAAREAARVASVGGNQEAILTRVEDAARPYDVTGPITVTVDNKTAGETPCDGDTRGDRVEVRWEQQFEDAIVLPFIPDISFSTGVGGVFRCEL